jgi:type VI secretion system protein ImpM
LPHSTLTPSSRQPGLYGKLHTHGDFVSRRLPQEFVSPWDAWLQGGIAESKVVLGSAWEDTYRNAPVWRFLLASGACGDAAWAGIVQPSVDRVGRHFPLTIAAALPGDIDALGTLFAASSWYAEVEGEAAIALEGGVRLDGLDSCLEGLEFPEDHIAHVVVTEEDTLPIAERVFSAIKVSLGRNFTYDAAKAAADRGQVLVGPWDCVWMNTGTSPIEPVLLVTKALPSPRHFGAFLDGRWEAYGWESGDKVSVSSG